MKEKSKKKDKRLYVSVYSSQKLNTKSICKHRQQCCYLVEVTYRPDDLSDEFSNPPMMAARKGGAASWKTLPTYLCDDWQRVDRVELDDQVGLFRYMEEILSTRFETPAVAWDIADTGYLYAHLANDFHDVEPNDVIEHFGILLAMDTTEADKIIEAYVCGSESRLDDLLEFMSKMFLNILEVTVRRAASEFGDY